MEEEESNSERQDNELEALIAIYGEHCEDLRKNDKWKVPRPPEVLLHLHPLESLGGKKDAHVQASVCFKFSKSYPNRPPEIAINKVVGLSDLQQKELFNKLNEKAGDLVGEVMVMELAELVREYLHECNRPQASSVYEEMLINQKKQEQLQEKEELKKRELQRRRGEIQRQEIASELERRKEEERRLRKLSKEQKEAKMRERSADGASPDPSFNENTKAKITKIEFSGKMGRNVFKGQCLGSSHSGSTVHAGLDSETGELVAIREWKITCPNTTKKANLTDNERSKLNKTLKTISNIQQEMSGLLKFYHENLVPYYGMKTLQHDTFVEVFVLQEFINGTSLAQRLQSKECSQLEFVKNTAMQLLHAIGYLHKRSIVHRNIVPSSVFINSRAVVKLSNFGVYKRLSDLYNSAIIEHRAVRFLDSHIPSGSNKKSDILMLGRILTSFPPVVPPTLPQNFKEFIYKCITEDESRRFTAEELLGHAFIKTDISKEEDQSSLEETEESPLKDSGSEDGDIDMISPAPSNNDHVQQLSRLHSEFEQLQWLGKGGFGDVVKVRNKLDDRFYAIKRILLDPRRLNFNKKITREVKLLSRLQHENVVRYYNSWLETLQSLEDEVDTSQSEPSTKTSPEVNSIGQYDDIEGNAPPPITTDTSWDAETSGFDDDDEESDDDSDVFDKIFGYNSDGEESIMFDRASTTGDSRPTASTTTSDKQADSLNQPQPPNHKTYLYIQMEYCDKSTLRSCIDEGLSENHSRRWRLFREILDGLSHVHEQGMIHRDLKPQNIFLDSSDHIKIGDFGLATARSHGVSANSSIVDLASSKSEGGDTGIVGTALYVAPEIMKSGPRTYTQKVDMYSVGIIFFEMCYNGLRTKMERVKVIGNLRTDKITLPDDFDEVEMERESRILRWCLNHNANKRPTALELIKSPYVPSPVLEESHIVNAVQQAMADQSSKAHRFLLHELFNRSDNQKNDVLYDMDMHKFSEVQNIVQAHVFKTVESLLQLHGAVKVNIPLLLPRQKFGSTLDTDNDDNDDIPPGTFLMDTSGLVISLPYDLRTPFARFVSRCNITNIKRYEIAKVFRSRRVFASHPKELWECAFDIVTPTVCNLIPEAECISMVCEIISSFPVLVHRNYKIFINHTLLLRSILHHAGIPEAKHREMISLLAEAKLERLSKAQLQTRLQELTLTTQQSVSLCSMIEQQGPLSKIQATLKPLTKSRQSSVASKARQALHELEALRKNLDSFLVKLPIVVHLGYVHNYKQFEGIIFQVSAEVEHKKRVALDVFAAGGRYDHLLKRSLIPDFHKLQSMYTSGFGDSDRPLQKICAAGVSIAIEKIVTLSMTKGKSSLSVAASNLCQKQIDHGSLNTVDVFVVAIGSNPLMHERMRIVQQLWQAGIRAKISVEGEMDGASLEELQKQCAHNRIGLLVIVKEKNGPYRVKFSNEDGQSGLTKWSDKLLPTEPELLDFLTSKINTDTEESNKSHLDSSSTAIATAPANSNATSNTNTTSSSYKRKIHVEMLPIEKMTYNVKKKNEALVHSKISQLPILKHLGHKSDIYVLAVDLPMQAINTLASTFNVTSGEDDFNESVGVAKCKLPKQKYIERIADGVYEARFENRYRVRLTLYYLFHKVRKECLSVNIWDKSLSL